MGPYVVFRHLSICEDTNKNIERIVGECPAIVRKRCRAPRVIRQNVWEQCPRHALCLGRRISPCVFQSVREGWNKSRVVCRFAREVGIFFFDKYYRLRRPRTALHLDPTAAIIWHKRARPQPHFSCSQSRVRHFKNDAAHIFVSEEIVACELEVVLRTFNVAEERVAAPASKEAGITCFWAMNAADNRGLCAVLDS